MNDQYPIGIEVGNLLTLFPSFIRIPAAISTFRASYTLLRMFWISLLRKSIMKGQSLSPELLVSLIRT